MKQSESVKEIYPAFIKAQSEMGKLIKNEKNPFFKSKYADLSAVCDTCLPTLNENKISVIQGTKNSKNKGEVVVTTRLIHESGEWIESQVNINCAKIDAQGTGSAITYGRRYLLASMCCLAQEDDDGEGAMDRKSKTPAPKIKNLITEEQAKEIKSLVDELSKSAAPPSEKAISKWASKMRGKEHQVETYAELAREEAEEVILNMKDKINKTQPQKKGENNE